jgi:hypothetical protein
VNLLKALEFCDEEEADEEQRVLSDEMVASIKSARAGELKCGLQPCENKRKNSKET